MVRRCDHDRHHHPVQQVPDFHFQGRARGTALAGRAGIVFIPKGKGVLVMPVPELNELDGIAEGTRTDDYRDRADRY